MINRLITVVISRIRDSVENRVTVLEISGSSSDSITMKGSVTIDQRYFDYGFVGVASG